MENYRIISELTEQQVCELTQLYKNEFWSQNRSKQDVTKMLATSDIVIGLAGKGAELIGFARVLTDFVYRAFIFDVIVKPTHRKQALGKKLLDLIVTHPQLQAVEYLGLYCLPEMVSFYENWGFTTELGGLQLMARPQRR
ncbi:GNAT family N-acetyltransferase [Lyngbya aestuarii]|uniref:GNAT family N-acetyltransferase n=1 Tax=Lyngbya aestuarii TaxID=118322 RepID=UPI00403D8C49